MAWAIIARALLAGAMIAAITEVGRRAPAAGALIASLPLVSLLSMVFLWYARPDPGNMATYSAATFWYVLPGLPMFLVMPALLRAGWGFWPTLIVGCALTVTLYFTLIALGPRFGLRL